MLHFFDILGTKDKIGNREFDDFTCLDFANPAALAARQYPKIRIAIFSDSVICSASQNDVDEFLNAIDFMYSNWYGDKIFVRGGISYGDLRWIDIHESEKPFLQPSNCSIARVYGHALIEAINVEKSSGPGAVPFLSDEASCNLEKCCSERILKSSMDILIFSSIDKIKQIIEWIEGLNIENKSNLAKRQLQATNFILKCMIQNKPNHADSPKVLQP